MKISTTRSLFKTALFALTAFVLVPGLVSSTSTPAEAQRNRSRHNAKEIAHGALRQQINRDAPRRDNITFRDTEVRSVGRNEKVIVGSGSFRAVGGRDRKRFTYTVWVNTNQDRATSVFYNVK